MGVVFAQDPAVSISLNPQYISAGAQVLSWEDEDGAVDVYIDTKKLLVIQPLDKDLKTKQNTLIQKNILLKGSVLMGIKQSGSVKELLFSNLKKGSFQFLSLDANFKIKHISEIIELDKREIIEVLKTESKWIVLSLERNSSHVHLYELDPNGNVNDYVYDFDDIDFGPKYRWLSSIMVRDLQTNKLEPKPTMTKVESSRLQKLEVTSTKKKLYVSDEQIILSYDHLKDSTILLMIDLEKHEHKVKVINKPSLISPEEGLIASNSVIFQDLLFQTKMSRQELAIQITDLVSMETIQTLGGKNGEISFRNTPFMYRNRMPVSLPIPYLPVEFQRRRDGEFQTSKEFFKEAKFSRLGLAVNENPEKEIELKVGFHVQARIDNMPNPSMDGFFKIYFISHLDQRTHSWIPGFKPQTSFIEQMIDYDDQIKYTYAPFTIKLFPGEIKPINSINNVFFKRSVANEYLYGYIDIDQNQMKLFRFSY